MKMPFYIILFSIILAGCSNKSLYQTGQSYQKSKCINEAQTAEQHNACLNAEQKSYKEYEKERKTVVSK